MDNKEMIEKLGSLLQLDYDAVQAYGEAIEKIEEPLIRENLIRYREDHTRHITDLSAVIREHGGTPPELSPDLKGFFIKGFTSLRSITGTEGALNAMHTNEKLTNKNYDEARKWGLATEIHTMIERHFEDERRHLEYIETTLETKPWKKNR